MFLSDSGTASLIFLVLLPLETASVITLLKVQLVWMTTLFNPSSSFLSSHNVYEYHFIRCIPIIPRLSLLSLRFHCTLDSNEKMEANQTLETLWCAFKLFSPDIVALLLSCLPPPNMFSLPQTVAGDCCQRGLDAVSSPAVSFLVILRLLFFCVAPSR